MRLLLLLVLAFPAISMRTCLRRARPHLPARRRRRPSRSRSRAARSRRAEGSAIRPPRHYGGGGQGSQVQNDRGRRSARGTHDVRVVCKWGISSPRLFNVHAGLRRSLKRPNDEPTTAQLIAMNSAVHAMSDGNKDDVFKFPAKKGHRVVIDCQAGKLDSLLDATMTLSAADGKLLASSGGYNGRDPLIDFIAPADGEYFVNVHDLSYRGGFPYRLVVTDLPQFDCVSPRALQAGKAIPLAQYGRNLGAGSKSSIWSVRDLSLGGKSETITAPGDLLTRGEFRFSDHPTTHRSANGRDGVADRLQVHGIPLLVTNDPVTLEVEPNDDRRSHNRSLPAVVSGRFDKDATRIGYEFETGEGGNYSFEVYCEQIGGRADRISSSSTTRTTESTNSMISARASMPLMAIFAIPPA